MSEYPIFIFTALLFLGFGLFSKLSEKSVLTAPMVFVGLGIIASFVPVDFLKEGLKAHFIKIMAEIALILVLFIDASTIDLKALVRDRKLPARLLGIGLPLTMALGLLVAIPLFPGYQVWALALMAFILSPTDAALGQAVVTSPMVPVKIRQTINVESGLNDGIALPPILVCLAVLSLASPAENNVSHWLLFTLKQFIFGPVIGGLVGLIGGYLVDKSSAKGWMSTTFQRLASVALAVMAFSLAEVVHGNGFIAAFFSGLMLGVHSRDTRERLHDFGEAESQSLALFIFLLFGMVLVPFAWPYWTPWSWVYALLSLTVIRMLPVALCLMGTNLSRKDIAFIGWFGPRGIASVLYLLLAVIQIRITGLEPLLSVIVLTILLSVFLHGVTAVPMARTYRQGAGVTK